MSLFDRRPRLRWAVPAGALAVALAAPALAGVASADSGLPPRSAEELLVDLQRLEPTPLSGTVVARADLGLPDLPTMGSADPALALATGESTVRVWYDGPQRQRVALLGTTSETLLVRDGQVAWVWDSADATADRYLLGSAADQPDDSSLADLLAGSDLPEGTELPRTPQQAAEMVLAALDPTTEVTTSGLADVAGRDAYQLVLTPRDPDTLVRRVTVSLDAETRLPLRLAVDSTAIDDPAFEVGFTRVDFNRPAADLFTFTPPQGATVTEHDLAGGPGRAGTAAEREEWAKAHEQAAGTGDEPTIVGEGWSTILIAELPEDALADLAERGMRDADEARGPHDRGDAATVLAMLEALPRSTGEWGSGRVLSGTLVSAILTDDGRLALGAVRPEALTAALTTR